MHNLKDIVQCWSKLERIHEDWCSLEVNTLLRTEMDLWDGGKPFKSESGGDRVHEIAQAESRYQHCDLER